MILNMVGANQVQIVDFTLSEDVDISLSEGLEIDNVALPNGTFSRFAILPISSITIGNGGIEHIYSPRTISNVSQSGLNVVYYTTVGDYRILRDALSENSYVNYDATNHKLKIKCSLASTWLRAANYRLVIW